MVVEINFGCILSWINDYKNPEQLFFTYLQYKFLLKKRLQKYLTPTVSSVSVSVILACLTLGRTPHEIG